MLAWRVAGRRRAAVLLTCLATCVQPLALAAQEAGAPESGAAADLRDTQRNESEHRAAAAAAAARAAAAAAQAARLEDARTAALARERQAEEESAEAMQRLAALKARAAAAEAARQATAAALQRLLPLAVRLSLYPSETLLAAPAPPETAISGVLVAEGLAREIAAEAASLQRETATITALSAEIAAARDKLQADIATQTALAASLDQQISAAAATARAETDAASTAAREAAADAAHAADLRAALARLAADRDAARKHARAAAEALARRHADAAATRAAHERAALLAAPSGPGLGAPRRALIAPVAGPLIGHFGAAGEAGIPKDQLKTFVDNIDLPVAGIPLAYLSTGSFGPEDADVLITLDRDHHGPTADYVAYLRRQLPLHFPGTTFYFMPADMNTQILNFGRPSPIDIQVTGPDLDDDYRFALRLYRDLVRVPGLVDTHLAQPFNYPTFQVDVDRSYAMMVGLTEADVTNSMLTSLYSNYQVSPNFYLDYKTGITYFLVGQTPQYRIDTMNDLINMPISNPGNFKTSGKTTQILGALATVKVVGRPGMVSHYNVQPMEEIFAAVQGRDLGGVSGDINRIIAANLKYRPPGVAVAVRGQVDTMNTAYAQLFAGLVGSVVLIYLLLVVNFQSWLDPFIIITALPAAIAGIVWMLFVTGTPLSVPALTGAIMCMGVATANSILVVAFAREQLAEGMNSTKA
ncbi:MAG: efflux RND transporter permease subunit, partial [Acidibrevibacterium sp.]|uniref:efflux RND transporter permease subunit n=1 Tax=Acidibrevibacterium fodinaquatile TaxID=1969806 RepID=UPI0023A7E416